MTWSRSGSFFLIALTLLVSVASLVSAGQSYNEKCEVGTINNTDIKVDTCDTDKFLTCRDSRCDCADRANQIWTSQLVKINTRSKRGSKSKGGRGKTILAAAAGAAGGAYLGSKISSATSGFSRPVQSKDKHKVVYSCLTRVGGQCLLPDANKGAISITYNIQNAPTAAAQTANTSDASNANATTPAPSPATPNLHQLVNITQLNFPPCVPNAICKKPEPKIRDGKVINNIHVLDKTVGLCECLPGYKADDRDICIKSGAAGQSSIGILMIAMISTFVSVVAH